MKINNGKIIYRVNDKKQGLCLICSVPVPEYKHYEKCCNGFMCGCNGEKYPNKKFPVCKKHDIGYGDMGRALIHFIQYHNFKGYTLDYCIKCLNNDIDYVKILKDNWEKHLITESFC